LQDKTFLRAFQIGTNFAKVMGQTAERWNVTVGGSCALRFDAWHSLKGRGSL